MRCDRPKCGADVRLVISSVCDRNEVMREKLCEDHGHIALRDYLGRRLPSTGRRDTLVNLDVDLIVSDGGSQVGAVYLREVGGERRLALACGIIEASAVAAAITEKRPARPLTHDAMLLIARSLGAQVERITIGDRLPDGNTFAADVRLRVRDTTVDVDMRPTDAICLAIRSVAPIFVAGWLL